MDHTELRERLRQRTGQAAADLAAAGPRPAAYTPRPGDLLVLPETAELPVEWLVLDLRPGPPARVQLVPADTCPLCAAGELALPAGEGAGPLTLRCHHALWRDAAALGPELAPLSGRLSDGQLARAREHYRALEDGTLEATLRQEETALDPEYQDWIAEVVEPARHQADPGTTRTAPARPAPPAPPGPRPSRRTAAPTWLYALAASLLVTTLGLTIALVQARRQEPEPYLTEAVESVDFGTTRGPTMIVDLPADTRHLSLELTFPAAMQDPYDLFRLVLLDGESEELIWRSAELTRQEMAGTQLQLYRHHLRPQLLLRLLGVGPDGETLIDEQLIQIRFQSSP